MKLDKVLSFDDVLLVPKYNPVRSRSEVSLATQVGGLSLESPILGANMPSVCGHEMATALSSEGALGIIHRMCSIEKQASMVQKSEGYVGAAIGIGDDWKERAAACIDGGAHIICVDVAHGDQDRVVEVSRQFLEEFDVPLIIGNIATEDAARSFIMGLCMEDQSRVALKSGVGGGSLCSTRVKTGFGLPTLESVWRISAALEKYGSPMSLIADGGLKNSGDICKSLAAGADAVMLGSLLSGTDEAPGDVVKNGDALYKMYAGSASHGAKKKFFGKAEYIEGAERLVPYKGPVQKIVQGLHEGIRSGMTYAGASNLEEFQVKAEFVQITAAGYRESIPHGLL
tara:strand:+ start:187 stop:1212 length:1026 start_codon:yes stop_codon:yes gene_type:complete